MKSIFYLIVVLASSFSAAGQESAVQPGYPVPGNGYGPKVVTELGRVRILEPDRMPCVIPDLARVERMPVQRGGNAEPMPNGLKAPFAVQPPFGFRAPGVEQFFRIAPGLKSQPR